MFCRSPVMLLLLVGAVNFSTCQLNTPDPARKPTAAPFSVMDVMNVVGQLKSEITNMKKHYDGMIQAMKHNHEEEVNGLNEYGLETRCESKISKLMQLYDEMRISNNQMKQNYKVIITHHAEVPEHHSVAVNNEKIKSKGDTNKKEAKYGNNPQEYQGNTDYTDKNIHESEINRDSSKAEYQTNSIVGAPDYPESTTYTELEQLRQLLQVFGEKSLDLNRAEGFTAFLAYMSSPYTGELGEILVFDDVRVNIGQGYDPATGHFIAPTTGLYVINRSHLADSSCGNDYPCISMLLNGNLVSSACSEWMVSTAKTDLIQLSAGDDLWLQLAGVCYSFFGGGGNHQSFSGYLLAETDII